MQHTSKKLFAVATASFALFWGASAQAESFESASKQAHKDLETALNDLAEVRGDIATQKIPMIREVSTLEDQVQQKPRSSNTSDVSVTIPTSA